MKTIVTLFGDTKQKYNGISEINNASKISAGNI